MLLKDSAKKFLPEIPGSGKKFDSREKRSAYIRLMQKDLLHWAIAAWSRREANLLEVNCGAGIFSRFFWNSGFNIIATEPDGDLRLQAQTRNESFLEVRACQDNDLPFDDDSFDWLVLHVRDAGQENLKRAIREALRVSKRGILLTFWNKISLAVSFADKNNYPSAISYKRLWRITAKETRSKMVLQTILWTPRNFWNLKSPIAGMNYWFSALPFGAWGILRVDFGYLRPVTPLALRVFPQFSQPQTAMEYSHKH